MTDSTKKPFLAFGRFTPEEVEEARAAATDAIEDYGDWQDSATWDRFRAQGIWNDNAAVQAALKIIAKRQDARADALREAGGAGYAACAETRHVTLGDKVSERILALIDKEPSPAALCPEAEDGVASAAQALLDALNEASALDDVVQEAMQKEADQDGTEEWVFILRAALRALSQGCK